MAEQMKPSGIDYIGSIPADWGVKRFKYCAQICNGAEYSNIEVDEGGYPVIGSGGEFARASKYCYNGQSVLLGRKGTIDKPLFVDGAFWCVDTMFYTKPQKNYIGKFLYYCALCFRFDYYVTSTALPSMTQKDLGSEYIAVPLMSEQQSIAYFLDKQCGKIDSIISDLEKQIETLQKYKKSLILETVTKGLNKNAPMKSSGIDWIGDIPAHWNVNKTKYLFSIVNGSTPESNNLNCWDGDISWITPADMEDFGEIAFGERNITTFGYDSCGTSLLPIGSIVISTRAPIGKINITTNVLCTNQGCKSLVGNKDNKYFFYLLYALKDQLTLLGRGTTFLELSTSALANFKIIIPKDEEQICIVNYLDCQCRKIDSILKDKQQQLEKIRQQKKSLIYEYVTGKKRVKEAINGN